jgi:hypothetical protein
MAKCESCGAEKEKEKDICPKCGLNTGPVTITALPKTPIRRRKKKKEKKS